ncbi:Beta-1,4-galactosyltransferase 2 [Bulinus truncatus]|nr:Beta-1,4-galactosyltransferase 2 [Bulinus truncatus]
MLDSPRLIKLFYESHFGGVVAYSRDQFLELNGYSNLYFGWGSEDDDMYNRVCNKGYSIVRYNETIARYDMIKHDRDIGNQENPLRHNLMKVSSMRQDVDGVNTVKYKVLDMQTEQLYTWIKVTFNINHLIQAAPPYVQEMLVQAQKSSIL